MADVLSLWRGGLAAQFLNIDWVKTLLENEDELEKRHICLLLVSICNTFNYRIYVLLGYKNTKNYKLGCRWLYVSLIV